MKKLLFICAVLFLAGTTAESESLETTFQIAKAVKLGRSVSAGLSTARNGVFAKQSFPCDANCKDCDHSTGICQKCTADRYISGDLCLSCPAKTYCDGVTATPNCSGVVCLSGSTPQASDTGCCCVK